jgi:hypothetical protein
MLGVKPFRKAPTMISGIELMYRIRKRQFDFRTLVIRTPQRPLSGMRLGSITVISLPNSSLSLRSHAHNCARDCDSNDHHLLHAFCLFRSIFASVNGTRH